MDKIKIRCTKSQQIAIINNLCPYDIGFNKTCQTYATTEICRKCLGEFIEWEIDDESSVL